MFRRSIACLLILSIAISLPAHAAMVATSDALDRGRILTVLERADFQAQLQVYGVSPADVKARVAALTDDEAAELAARIDELPAGGVSILGVALIVFLVLLLTDILGYTKVFPFTKPMK
ncbi:MAG TPA: PA2779 family protein [Burkholderiales bacterium]|jgi:hypothetical protein